MFFPSDFGQEVSSKKHERKSQTVQLWQEGLKGPDIFQSVVDHWRLGPSRARGRWLLWFASLEWRPGLLIEVRIEPTLRRILRFRRSPVSLPRISLFAAECIGEQGILRDKEVMLLPNESWDGKRAYLATWVGSGFIGDEVNLRTSVIDLPLSATGAAEPSLRDRILTVFSDQYLSKQANGRKL